MIRLNQHRIPQLIAGAALPKEIITLYADDDDEMKLAMRGFWQSLHIYGRCWLRAEPLDQHTIADQDDTLYKCRFASSSNLLGDSHSSFVFLLPQEQVQEFLDAPMTPIEWVVVTDAEGNECPVNVYGWETCHWQSNQQPKASSKCQEHSSDRSQPEPGSVQKASPSSLTQYKERKSEEPVDPRYEQVAKATIQEAMKEFYPEQIAAGQMPPRKYLPLILVKAVQKTLEHQLEYERDPRQRAELQQRIEDMDLMTQKEKMWYWDRERYVKVLWTDELTGVCAVNVGIHPRLRVRNDVPLHQKKRSHKHKGRKANHWQMKRSRGKNTQSVA